MIVNICDTPLSEGKKFVNISSINLLSPPPRVSFPGPKNRLTIGLQLAMGWNNWKKSGIMVHLFQCPQSVILNKMEKK